MLNHHEIDQILRILSIIITQPTTELIYDNEYHLAIAVILSAQSTDKQVNLITPKLFRLAKTPQDMLQLGEERLKELIRTLGLFNNKAKNIIAMSKQLLENFGGRLPNNLQDLSSLAGIGPKSAKVLLNNLWKQPYMAVDTHVHRVSNRLGICITKNPLETDKVLPTIIPEKWHIDFHNLVVLFGRYTCKAIKPDCKFCPVKHICKNPVL